MNPRSRSRSRSCAERMALVALVALGWSAVQSAGCARQARAQAPAPEQASPSKLFVAAGGELWTSPQASGHGYALVHYQRERFMDDARLDVLWNTDTALISVDGYRLGERARVGGYLKAQGGFAGLLPRYYQEGVERAQRGFLASYVQTAWTLRQEVAPHFIQLEVGGRRWDFRPAPSSAAGLTLPDTRWELEPRLRYTYWALSYDPATDEAHRHYWRTLGLAWGVELGGNLRDRARPFGALSPEPGAGAAEDRNAGDRAVFIARAWARAGTSLGSRARVQGALFGATGAQEDDLTRVRAGGLNPYVVPLGGLPWASYLPDRLLASELSLHIKAWGDSEVGVMGQSALMPAKDLARRAGAGDAWGGLLSAGVFGDWRWGPWQVDTRVGLAPAWRSPYDELSLSAWLSVGRRLF